MLGKGQIQPNHLPVSKFDMLITGIPIPLHFVTLSGIEEETDMVELPDRTRASGGRTKPVEFTASIPLHHTAEFLALEELALEAVTGVATYKRPASLLIHKLDGGVPRSFLLEGLWVQRRRLPDLDANNDGEMATVEYTFQADSIVPGT